MSSRPHFLHVFPDFAPGGMELRVIRIINGMRSTASHTILALFGNYEAKEFIDRRIEVKYLDPPERRGIIPYVLALRRLIRRVAPDLLLTYNWGAIDAVIGACSSGFRPILHHECGFGAEESLRLKQRRVIARRILLQRVFSVAVTSRSLRDICVRQFGLPPDRVRWIRTGVDVERFRPGLSRGWRQCAGVRDDELLFGFVGGLRAEKNLRLLLRAFAAARIPNAKLALIGDGDERALLGQTAEEEGISERVLFPGRVRDPAVCLAALDVFVMSSCTEQTSNALLEAMACGLSAISTDVGDSSELLGNVSHPVIVPSGDLVAYTEALRVLARSADLRSELGAANRQRCLQHYPLERMVREYEALYQKACQSRSPAGQA